MGQRGKEPTGRNFETSRVPQGSGRAASDHPTNPSSEGISLSRIACPTPQRIRKSSSREMQIVAPKLRDVRDNPGLQRTIGNLIPLRVGGCKLFEEGEESDCAKDLWLDLWLVPLASASRLRTMTSHRRRAAVLLA